MATEALAKVSDIPEGSSIAVMTPNDQEIALFNINGKIYAIDNECPHAGGPLAEGDINDTVVKCPWHGWEFDLKTGACINSKIHCVAIIPIEIKDGLIFLKD